MSSAVEVDGVWKYFGDYPALKDIQLQAERGDCVALLGRNGAGKTTLLRIIAGLSKPSKGMVRLEGKSAKDSETRARIGILGHGIAVYDELTARENLRLFGRLFGLANPAKIADEWLERTGLSHAADGKVREYSRGMRQRLALARVFLHDPALLVLDEPFTALDDRAIDVLQTLLGEALGRGCTIVMSTHQIREAMVLTTRVALIVRGKLAHTGPRTNEMLSDPGWLYRTYGEA